MLNKNNDSGQPYLTLDLRGKALSLLPLSMMVVVVFLQMSSIRLRKFPSIPSLPSFFLIMKRC